MNIVSIDNIYYMKHNDRYFFLDDNELWYHNSYSNGEIETEFKFKFFDELIKYNNPVIRSDRTLGTIIRRLNLKNYA